MHHLKIFTFLFSLLLIVSCSQEDSKESVEQEVQQVPQDVSVQDKEEIQKLIQKVLIWGNESNPIDLIPGLRDSTDSIYSGFDLEIHKNNLEKLRKTNFFTSGFIENYNQIILTLDNNLKDGKYGVWYYGEMPPFDFSMDYSPWCNCQDYEDWNKVVIKVIHLTEKEGDIEWNWGSSNPYSMDFSYPFKVRKENNQWKIDYMSGFDLEDTTK